MTALGPVRLDRQYTWHRDEGGTFRADHVLGIGGFLTRQATRLLVLGALAALVPLPYVNVPFDVAVAWLGIALMRRSASPSPQRHLRRVRT